jgi:hypothetical protein
LSRNKNLQNELLSENTLNFFENILEKLAKTKHNEKLIEMIENILIEIISIIKRFLSLSMIKDQPKFAEKIIKSNLIENLIFLLQEDNLIILKSLHILLLSLMEK